MSEPTTAGVQNIPQQPAGEPAPDNRGQKTGFQRFMSGSVGRNLGLVVALLLICAAGVITAGDRFASIDNMLTILDGGEVSALNNSFVEGPIRKAGNSAFTFPTLGYCI